MVTRQILLKRAQSLRKKMTPSELKLWRILRCRNLQGFKFRTQHPRNGFILDFYCPKMQLAIELDGKHHSQVPQQSYDSYRSSKLLSTGVKVIRFTNQQISKSFNEVLNDIKQQLSIRAKELGFEQLYEPSEEDLKICEEIENQRK